MNAQYEAEDESEIRTCTGCGAPGPAAATNGYTPVSQMYGWHFRHYSQNGHRVTEWWCKECWGELKKENVGEVTLIMRRPPGL